MNAFLDELVRNLSSPLSSLILQILVILLVARLCGILVRYLGQPQVIGEILAGILLGPSLLKIVAPDVLRSNPRCEAPGTMIQLLEASSG